MLDKDTGIFIAKIVMGLIVLILLFTVIIPKWKEIDNVLNENLRRWVGIIFNTSSSFKKNLAKEKNKYLVSDFYEFKNNFIKQFLEIKTPVEIKHTISLGNKLRSLDPKDIEIIRDIAFLYYINEDYDKAIECYETVLRNYPKWRRRFKHLKGKNSRSVKRALVELAAVYYEQGDTNKMFEYYKQYLRASLHNDFYQETVSHGIDEQTAKFNIFKAISGEGYLSYKKAIALLEIYASEYPSDNDIYYYLGLYNFDLVNLFGFDD